MNNERFVIISTDEFEGRICDRANNNEFLNLEQLLDLLNGYEILCLMLMSINSELHDTIIELKEENEKLRKDKAQLKERLRESNMRLDRFNCR